MDIIGKLQKLDDGRWLIRLDQYNNVGFFIHPYEVNRKDFIENEYYYFSINPWNKETEYYAHSLNKVNELKHN